MGEMENQAEFYYEKLKASTNPGKVLLELSRELVDKELGIILINKLVKLFGRFTVFFSIMDLSKIEKLDGNLYPLLYTICKSRFEKIHNDTFSPAQESLDRQINDLEKAAEKVRKAVKRMDLPTSEGL